MDAERDQVRLILEDLLDHAATAADPVSSALSHARAANHESKAQALLRVDLWAMEKAGISLVSDGRDKVGAVSRTVEAFEMLGSAVEKFLEPLPEKFDGILAVHEVHADDHERAMSLIRAARIELGDTLNRVRRKLELERFDFLRPAADSSDVALSTIATMAAPAKRGGRPPAEFWDDMWAHIAAALYGGELIPKSQADIEKAMAEWIEGQGHSAATSTIRARARRLWDRLSAADDD